MRNSNHPSRAAALVFALALCPVLLAADAHASKWPNTTEPNVAVSTAFDRQLVPRSASDGAGGVIVVWQDLRNQLDYNVFAQRIDSHGNALWTTDGVSVSSAVFNQTDPQIIPDGAGGAIVVWEDTRGGAGKDIYAQRIDADGNMLWTPNGVAVTTANIDQQAPSLTTDGAGGAIFAWEDTRTGLFFEVYAQRIDAAGAAQWAANGVVLGTGFLSRHPQLAADGAGGAIVAWEDGRNGPTDIYAQRVDSSGGIEWTANGIAIRSVGWDVFNPHVVPSISSGAIITWEDAEFPDHDLEGARVIGDGTVLPKYTISNGIGDHRGAHVVSDNNNGAIVTYMITVIADDAVGVQRLDLYGPVWNGQLPVVFGAGADEENPRVAADASGGAVVTWEDDRYGTFDIFAAAMTNGGVVKWGTNQGTPVTTAIGPQFEPDIVADDNGGAVIVWRDHRDQPFLEDVYAQRIEGNGYLGYPSPDITSITDVPQDNGGAAIVSWSASELDAFPDQEVRDYSIWRRPGPAAVAAEKATRDERFERAVARGIEPGLAAQMASAGWNLVDTQTASYLSEYSYNAPTYGDSTGAGQPLTEFMVVAQTNNQFMFWQSLPATGYSVDNLAPSAPLNLVGQEVGNDVQLDWELPDMNYDDITHYNVYRSPVPGLTPIPANFLASVPDLTLLDTTTGGMFHAYIVTAVDLSEQESAPSNEVGLPTPTGVGDQPPSFPAELTLLPNAPNPFSGATTIRFGMPAPADVDVEVYDVKGRLVFRDRVAGARAGWHDYPFDGRDASGARLASGIYLLRVTGAGSVQTRKLTIMR